MLIEWRSNELLRLISCRVSSSLIRSPSLPVEDLIEGYVFFLLRILLDFCKKMKMRERKSAKSNTQHEQHQNGHLSSFTLTKLLDPDVAWDKDELCDVLHRIRQGLALVCGLIWGAIPLVGGIWLMLFLVLSTGLIYGYYALVLKIDEEDFGGHGALLQEGLFASICVFLLAWILVYSLAHF